MRDAERHPWRAEPRHLWLARRMHSSDGSGHTRSHKMFNRQCMCELQVVACVPRAVRFRWLAPCSSVSFTQQPGVRRPPKETE